MQEKYDYNTPPSEEVFADIKHHSLLMWKNGGWSDEFGYLSGKINRVNRIENKFNNVIAMFQMFHPIIRRELVVKLLPESREYLKKQGFDL